MNEDKFIKRCRDIITWEPTNEKGMAELAGMLQIYMKDLLARLDQAEINTDSCSDYKPKKDEKLETIKRLAVDADEVWLRNYVIFLCDRLEQAEQDLHLVEQFNIDLHKDIAKLQRQLAEKKGK